MRRSSLVLTLFFALTIVLAAQAAPDLADWRVYVTHDNCPDYTWGFTEDQTRHAMADLVLAHLEEMRRTDAERAEARNHYNMAVTQEALCFLETYPGRQDELVRRIKEGRITASPFLCNSLWGFQSTESFLRTLYPARRLERTWGVRLDVAEHIELPSLPWGTASLLAGSGIRWVSIPFLNYDCAFAGLQNPPLFLHQGPDGSTVGVISPPDRTGLTIAPAEAFLLRLDLDPVTFEALGNDQNYKEETQDQDGVAAFTFRYALRAHSPGYDNAETVRWSRMVLAPPMLFQGRLPAQWLNQAGINLDPARAIATCLKPADEPGPPAVLLRLWETGGQSGPASLTVPGYSQRAPTDLLERLLTNALPGSAQTTPELRAHGFTALRLW